MWGRINLTTRELTERNTPDSRGKPTAPFFLGRGLGTDSGETPKDEGVSVPYKKNKNSKTQNLFKNKNLEITKSDITIINEVLAGSKSAFKMLYQRYARNHMLTCLRYVKNKSDAEDLLQEAYIKIYRDLKQFDSKKAKFGTWSNRIVINTCLMKLRKKNGLGNFEDIADSSNMVKVEALAIDDLSLQELTKLIMELPNGYRTVFNLFVIDGFSHQEIAEKLGVSVNTSKTQLWKAKKELQTKIKLRDISLRNNYAK